MAIQHTLFISATRLKKDTALGGSVDDNLIMPTKKPRIVAAMQPQNETNNVFNTPTKYTSRCVSVDLKSIKGEKLISNPAGSVRNLQPVAIFLFSKL